MLDCDDAFPDDETEWEDSDGDGVGDNSDGCPYDPNNTDPANCEGIFVSEGESIQDAINASSDGETIIVAPGTYASIAMPPHSIHIVSQSGPEVTIIDAEEIGVAVLCENTNDSASLYLTGFTLTRGTGYLVPVDIGQDLFGGGGLVVYNAKLHLDNCIVKENHSWGWAGGGVLCAFGDLTITNSVIHDNSAHYGGGLNVFRGAVLCDNVHFHSNIGTAPYAGGGVDIWSPNEDILDNQVILRNVLIEDNYSTDGSNNGIYNGGKLVVSNTVTQSILNAGWISFDPEFGASDLVINGDYGFVHGSDWYGADGGRFQLFIHEQDGVLVSDTIHLTGQFGVQFYTDTSGSIGLIEIENISGLSSLGEQFELLTFSSMVNGFSAIKASGFGSTNTLDVGIGSTGEAFVATVVDAIQIVGENGGEQPLDNVVHSLISGDFNGDGYEDICLAMPSSAPGWQGQLLFMANGGVDETNAWMGFSGETLLVGLQNVPSCIFAGNISGDGLTDVIVALPDDSALALATNVSSPKLGLSFDMDALGGGAMNRPIDVSLLPTDVGVHDKLVVVNEGQPSVSVLGITLNPPVLSEIATQTTVSVPSDVAVQELDSTIVVSQSEHNNILVFSDGGSDPLGTQSQIDMSFGQSDIELCDLNGDGLTDIVASIPMLEIIAINLGLPDGTYQPWLAVSVNGQPDIVVSGDFDADGDVDLAVLVRHESAPSTIDLFQNELLADYVFVLTNIDSLDLGFSNPVGFLLTDLDGNGTDDFVVVTETSGTPLRGAVNGLSSILMNINDSAENQCEGDLDADGDVDVADLLTLIAAWGTCDGCSADFDGDNDVDVADLLTLIAAWGACP